jgi:hypothetical protein
MLTILAALQLVVVITLLQADTATDFSDLGRKMLAGFVIAVVVAVALAFIRFRQRDKNPTSSFISITSSSTTDKTDDD